ncbi:hypothetical protein DL766_000510 [Monosporascus sp. MC13-8B]|uniref:NmrA-like domain-containing protein n=1 Tax=Monosporascus cannonballus TaxID=155416 RepID=A0ABY0GQD0_9PEZI|nr:hypothetical protein DL762_010457 [Monosporascus cannonballus]RYO76412.1 hypothetical protein DL763_010490 [Monosporascus cannonballus]RYP39252.1 hypothetical protein DL766_000510 [Monosporascus sp. MC13-8B]
MSSTKTKTESKKTIAFFGATGGCALSTLRYSLAAGHTCIALCRTPSKLTGRFPSAQYSNLTVVQGNAHDADAVARCLVVPSDPSDRTNPGTRLVDTIVFSIGGAFIWSRLTLDDPHVCERGIAAVLEAIGTVRARFSASSSPSPQQGVTGWRPTIIAVSTTGISRAGRDIPLLMVPLYHALLRVPHADKRALEDRLVARGSSGGDCDYDYVVVRPSLLTDGAKPERDIRVGVEDLHAEVFESRETGNVIAREDVGRWIFEELVEGDGRKRYHGKAVSITW